MRVPITQRRRTPRSWGSPFLFMVTARRVNRLARPGDPFWVQQKAWARYIWTHKNMAVGDRDYDLLCSWQFINFAKAYRHVATSTDAHEFRVMCDKVRAELAEEGVTP